MEEFQILSPAQIRERQMLCIENGTCFVSLRKITPDTPVKAIEHPDGYLSTPILVMKEYVK